MKTELLAPAGDIDAGYSAFYYGADAIYLGLTRFSARAGAVNFSREELDEITAYAHSIGKKVYVAFNTLVQENELNFVLQTLQTCKEFHVDALIVQDLGVARIVKKSFPTLALHASTQLAVHNLQGVLALQKMGFERVVLARELSLNQIQNIKDNCDVELEVFVHGALCYSMSGLCSFSAQTTARSANRGKCVYSCRNAYTVNGKTYHPFSMKDMALEKDVLKLSGLSLKIEGRKKNALYVAAVTDYYRRILNGENVPADLSNNLKQIFARPWTKLHFNGKNKDVFETQHMGPQGLLIGTVQNVFNNQVTFKTSMPFEKRDGLQINIPGVSKPLGFSVQEIYVNNKHTFKAGKNQTVTVKLPDSAPFIKKGSEIYLSSCQAVKSAYPFDRPKSGLYKNKTHIDVGLFITPTEIMAMSENKTFKISDTFSPAKNIDKVNDAIKTAFTKTGDYAFDLGAIKTENKQNLFVPLSILNDVRRGLYEQINITQTAVQLPGVSIDKEIKSAPKWQIKIDDVNLLSAINLTSIDTVFINLTPDMTPEIMPNIKNNIVLSLPTVSFNLERYQKTILSFINAGFTQFEVNNISALNILPKSAQLIFGPTMNMLNAHAIEYAKELGASAITFNTEDTKENIEKLTGLDVKTTVIAYQDIPLFISKNCIRENDCSVCDKKPMQMTLMGKNEVLTAFSNNCLTTVIQEKPFYIAPLINNLKIDNIRLDFCLKTYTASEINTIIQLAQNNQAIKDTKTGNFLKASGEI